MRTWAPALLLIGAAACVDEPDYTGRLCSALDPCPAGYVCGADDTCVAEGVLADAGPADAGPSDAGPLDGGERDAGAEDAARDAGHEDAAVEDAAVEDSGPPDADLVGYPTAGWQVRYFALPNLPDPTFGACLGVDDLTGDALDVAFGVGESPGGGALDFGAEYSGRRTFSEGVQTVFMDHDDGVRVYVDDALVYEDWDHGRELGVVFRTPYLSAGPHYVRVELFDDDGEALLRLGVEPGCTRLEAPATGWLLSYHRVGAGDVLEERVCYGVEVVAADPLSWSYTGAAAPAPALARGVGDAYATVARAQRNLRGLTRLEARHDDGLRLFVDQSQVLGAWAAGGFRTTQGSLHTVGVHELRVEKFDAAGDDRLDLALVNVCDDQPTLAADQWFATYYPVTYTASPPDWALDRGDCLGAEVLQTTTLAWTLLPGLVSAAGYQSLWGAEYFGDRTFATSTQLSLRHDDGLRIWSGATLWYDSWTAPQVITDTLTLPPGSYRFRVEYFENQGGEQLSITW